MKLVLLPASQALNELRASLGSNPAEIEGVADLLREEVSARGSCLRSTTIKRVCRSVAPAFTLDTDFVSEVCHSLERLGDFVSGAGGLISATPVRAIDLEGGVFRFACSLPTGRLRSIIPGAWEIHGALRTCRVETPDRVREAVQATGGVVLSPSVWAGLDRTPPADDQWLGSLGRRLQAEPSSPGSLERDEHLSWSGCIPTTEGIRWKSDEAAKTARLWRARTHFGYWHYAWTENDSPAVSPFVLLRPDEGARTSFAIARVSGAPVKVTLRRDSNGVALAVPNWLPGAEYRFLAVSASPLAEKQGLRCWLIPLERAKEVLDVLKTRLGVAISEEKAG